jgi:hypothetical protein
MVPVVAYIGIALVVRDNDNNVRSSRTLALGERPSRQSRRHSPQACHLNKITSSNILHFALPSTT